MNNQQRGETVNKQRIIRRTLLALALTAFGASSMAQVPEAEPNHPLTAANADRLNLSGSSISVQGTVGKLSTGQDVDFFAFTVQANDTVKVDIKPEGFDAWIFAFEPGPPYRRAFWGLNELPAFPVAEKAGKWVVGVTADGMILLDNGTTARNAFSGGAYALTITVTSAETHILLDIKPGSAVSPINPKAQGTIPVALLSSEKFTPLEVDTATLTFGKNGDEPTFRRCNPAQSAQDLNADGKPDLVCHFDNGGAGFQRGDSVGTMRGKTKSGQAFKGTGDLKAVPEKRQN
jgi:hypothetical protein